MPDKACCNARLGRILLASAALAALAACGSLDGASVCAALQGMRFQGPTGEELIRPGDHQVLKDYYLLRGKPQAQMRDEDDLAEIISAGRSFIEVDHTGCALA